MKAGNTTPDVSSKEKFDDDAYLKPVLEDDALLYSLGDIEDEDDGASGSNDAERRVVELQEDLERLQSQFSEYRLAVQRSMEEQLSQEDNKLSGGSSAGPSTKAANKIEEAESDYFSSYSYNGIYDPEFLCCCAGNLTLMRQQSTSLCSRTLSVPTPTVTSSMKTSVSSRTRSCWMLDVARVFSPCSVPKQVPNR